MGNLNLEKENNEELLNRLLIENHNIESCAKKMQKEGRTDSLWELFELFKSSYEAIYAEILRRMEHGS